MQPDTPTSKRKTSSAPAAGAQNDSKAKSCKATPSGDEAKTAAKKSVSPSKAAAAKPAAAKPAAKRRTAAQGAGCIHSVGRSKAGCRSARAEGIGPGKIGCGQGIGHTQAGRGVQVQARRPGRSGSALCRASRPSSRRAPLALHGAIRQSRMFGELVEQMERFSTERSAALRDLDAEREAEGAWYRNRDMLGMQMYIDNFAENHQGRRGEARLPQALQRQLHPPHALPRHACR